VELFSSPFIELAGTIFHPSHQSRHAGCQLVIVALKTSFPPTTEINSSFIINWENHTPVSGINDPSFAKLDEGEVV
jgi:hypothetical protein